MVVEPGAGADVARITKTSDHTKSADRTTIGTTTPITTTSVVPRRSPPPPGRSVRSRRCQPSQSRKRTTEKPIAAPAVIPQNRFTILCCCGLAGSSAFSRPQPAAASEIPTSASARATTAAAAVPVAVPDKRRSSRGVLGHGAGNPDSMAELTPLQEKLGEVLGLALAAPVVLDKVEARD